MKNNIKYFKTNSPSSRACSAGAKDFSALLKPNSVGMVPDTLLLPKYEKQKDHALIRKDKKNFY